MELSLDQLIEQYNKLYDFVIKRNINLQELAIDAREKIIKNNPSWDKNKDSRFTIFFRITTALRNCQIGITNTKPTLAPEKWKNLQRTDAEAMLLEYDKFLRFSFFQFLFSQMESAIRIIMRDINSNAYYEKNMKKKYPFNNIYTFIDNYLGLKKYNDLFKLLRLIRNSIHNNGMYFPDDRSTVTITYRGQKYLFEDSKPISCGDWITLFNITEDLINALKVVIESQQVLSINYIDDPVPGI